MSAAAAELLALVAGDPATHGQLAAAIGCSTAWLPGRERTKTNNIRCIHEMRMPMREFGRRMVERGAFDEIEDFGFVREAEMRRGHRRRSHPLDARSASGGPSTSGCRSWCRRSCSSAGPTDPTPGSAVDAPCRTVLACGDTLAGLPGCPGVGRGHRPGRSSTRNDPTALQPGDVLIAPITDPSWTPLFVPAAAVVVDVGARAQPRDHRQPRARHPVRHLGDRRDPAHPRRSAGPRRRQHRHGHGAGPER